MWLLAILCVVAMIYGHLIFKSQASQTRGKNDLPIISAEQYACRSAMLSSLVVAWSPMLDSKSGRNCCILAIGAKSGKISFWRVNEPQCYSITQGGNSPPGASLIGFIKAHGSWVTTISFSKIVFDDTPQLLLSSGSSDGR